MLANNKERLHIFLRLENKYDYAEFKRECLTAKSEPLSWLEYTQKAQAVLNGMEKYPDLAVDQAYLKIVEDQKGGLIAAQPQPSEPVKANCGGCGGGKVL